MLKVRDLVLPLLAGFVLWAPAFGAEPGTIAVGQWSVITSVDRVTDARSTIATIDYAGAQDVDDVAWLSVFCAGRALGVGLHTRGFWPAQRRTILVTHRFDQRPAVAKAWMPDVHDGKRATLIADVGLLDGLRAAAAARFRVSPASGDGHEANFALAGAPLAIGAVAASCGAGRK